MSLRPARRPLVAALLGALVLAVLAAAFFLARGLWLADPTPTAEGSDPAPPTSAGSTSPSPTAEGSDPAPPTPEGPEPIAALGEVFELTAPGGGEPWFTLTVTEVSVQATCPSRGAEIPPESGAFVVASVTAELSADAPEPTMPLLPPALSIGPEEGRPPTIVATEASAGCYDREALLPPFLSPGERVEGLVVFDVDLPGGAITYTQPGGEQLFAWAYSTH